MPQLHDSGNRLAGPAAHRDDTARIFGLETEYGISVSGARIDAAQVAMLMFQPMVRSERSTNTYVDNGSRLYLDVGAHPEVATAEARTPRDMMVCDGAGELIMRAMALEAQERLHRDHPQARIHVFKNNLDSAGNSCGCHENYLVRRRVPLKAIETQLLPFLISRQIYTGAGHTDGRAWTYTQRAGVVDETVSSATTRSRPMVNTRDEPHADPDSFRRLHVIIGDSNRSQWATMMKAATTHYVLCAMEWSARTGEANGLEGIALADPITANLAVDAQGPDAQLGLADGSHATALELQLRILDVVENFAARHPLVDGHDFDGVLGQWRWVLGLLADRDLPALAHVVDWACKRVTIEGIRKRRHLSEAQVRQLDLDYHDVANGALYESLLAHGRMRTLAGADELERAVHEPPRRTRAVLRGRFVQEARRARARFSCDWTALHVQEPFRQSVTLLDPFDDRGDAQCRALLDRLAALPATCET
ncbi:proteasome accessory factor PafA2 family protein [Bifidobacterium cuniculi]|uniref:Proteasome-associated protein n=1 Tax=Bifidobacterium cuniculi TaxID=1688 RepID=A0A087AX40_9BIFI|nr:proteasome accessory factor PafA2 family protein [Bifidobacterium cuniculi]KFI63340.1 proteasome-associated protein [Bifidobacterium cuniculi]